ncbi:MAG: hypothetical protein OXC07_00850 [Kistimonas sp.]|nr:hypothetical protein [Kistimonas sp.]
MITATGNQACAQGIGSPGSPLSRAPQLTTALVTGEMPPPAIMDIDQAIAHRSCYVQDTPPLSSPPSLAESLQTPDSRSFARRILDPSCPITEQDEKMFVTVLTERKQAFRSRTKSLNKEINELKLHLQKRAYSLDQREALLARLRFPLSYARPPCCSEEGLDARQCQHLERLATLGCGLVFDKGPSLELEADWAYLIPEELLIRLFGNSDRIQASRLASVLIDSISEPILRACLARFPEYVNRIGRDIVNVICHSNADMSKVLFRAQVQASAKGSILPASCLTGSLPCSAAALLYTCYNMGRLEESALQRAMQGLGRDNQASYMAAAACLGMERLYEFFEKANVSPDYEVGFASGNMLHYLDCFCPRDAAESSVASFTAREKLLKRAPAALFQQKNAQGCTPLTAWIQRCRRDSTEAQGSSHLASRVRWSLFYFLMEATPGKVSISKTVAPRALSHWDREMTSAQCRLLLENRLAWNQGDIGRFPFLQALVPLLPADRKLDTEEKFVAFMDRLVHWTPTTRDCPLRDVLPDWLEVMRPELRSGPGTQATAADVRPFNTNGGDTRLLLEDLFSRTTWFKYKLIAGFLEQGSEDKVAALLHHWLEERNPPAAISWLFEQKVHPNSTLFREHFNFNVLLNAALKLSKPPGVPEDFPSVAPAIPVSPDMPKGRLHFMVCTQPDQVFGRTMVWMNQDGENHYLKLQDQTETAEQFKAGCARMKWLYEKAGEWELLSSIGQPRGVYTLQVEQLPLDIDETEALAERVGVQDVLALHFTLPPDAPYENYITDPSLSAEEFSSGLHRYAQDAGTLWARGINGPDCFSTFHDAKTGRTYQFLAEISAFINLGMLEDMQKILLYPNVGVIGMRDQMDIWACTNAPADYFCPNNKSDRLLLMIDPSDDRDISRVRLMEVGKAAWGGILLCGYRCQRMREKNQPFDLKAAVSSYLQTFLSQAFDLPADEIRSLMETDDLGHRTPLDQMTQELRYWMDDIHGTCIRDSIQSIVDPETYPHLLAKGVGIIAQTEAQLESLHANVENKVYHLGVMRNGRNPILAGSGLIVKLLTTGVLRTWQRQKLQDEETARLRQQQRDEEETRFAALDSLLNGTDMDTTDTQSEEDNPATEPGTAATSSVDRESLRRPAPSNDLEPVAKRTRSARRAAV